VSERTINKTLPARNTLIQLLVMYTDPDSHNTQRYRPTDGRTDGHDDANSQSYCSSMIG